ncbi:hypothetical protein RJT17_36380 [Streptomyces sp. P5-A9]|uniref:hypothetical protein n=1 Tax=Streptomyces sp. P5-A9 TaxID=3071730 RepID=UPI002FC5C884
MGRPSVTAAMPRLAQSPRLGSLRTRSTMISPSMGSRAHRPDAGASGTTTA